MDIVVEGNAIQVIGDCTIERLAAAWALKWDGRWRYEVRGVFHHESGGAALVLSVTPTKILAFAKGNFSQTRYRF
jgi:hypothetical protein